MAHHSFRITIAAPLAAVLFTFVTATHGRAQNQPVASPASYDWGVMPVGTREGTNFYVENLPPGATMSAAIRGDASFTISPTAIRTVPGATPNSRPEPNEIPVMFTPSTAGEKAATLVITIGSRTLNVPLKGMGGWECRRRLVECNYDFLYSGTFLWRSSGRIPTPNPVPITSYPVWRMEETITAVLTDGIVICDGTVEEVRDTFTAQRHDEKAESRGIVRGQGLITIEFGDEKRELPAEEVTPGVFRAPLRGPWYDIKVACPSASGTWTSTNMQTGVTETGPLEVEPVDINRGAQYSDRKSGRWLAQVLEGSTMGPNDHDDPVNGVSGAIYREWRFTLTPPTGSRQPRQ